LIKQPFALDSDDGAGDLDCADLEVDSRPEDGEGFADAYAGAEHEGDQVGKVGHGAWATVFRRRPVARTSSPIGRSGGRYGLITRRMDETGRRNSVAVEGSNRQRAVRAERAG
jgi:hypothetical protein